MSFSCGSTNAAPITPAVGISLDSLMYWSDDGLLVDAMHLTNYWRPSNGPLINKRSRQVDMMESVLEKIERLEEENRELRENDRRLEDKTDRLEANDQRLEANDQRREGSISSVMRLVRKSPSSGHGLMADVLISVGVVLCCGLVVALITRRRQQRDEPESSAR